MYKGKKILAVVPARGGSKGVPLKNIKKLCNKPLVGYTGDLINELNFIDRAIVSTDSEKIGTIASNYGIDFLFKRPVNISGDYIGDFEVLDHALREIERIDCKEYDVVIMLQPTCPFRKPEHVKGPLKRLLEKSLDSVWTVSESDTKNHPLKQLVINKDNNLLNYYDKGGSKIIARQQLDLLYQRNGAAYCITRDCLLNQKSIKGKKTGAFIVEDFLVNIDTPTDFSLAEYYIKKNIL